MKNLRLIFFLSTLVSCNFWNHSNKNIESEYYPNGNIKSETPVKDGKRNGTTKYYDEHGRLMSTVQYVDDKREGWLINYNSEIGKPVLKGFFKNDTQCGPVTQYYLEGMLFRESNYVKGRVDGVIKTYWPNGKLKAENYYKMGKPSIGLKEYDKEGKLITDQPKILIQQSIEHGFISKIILKISISSDEVDRVEIFNDELIDGKYLPDNAFKIPIINGVSTLEYPVSNGRMNKKRLSIIAKFRTKNGDTMILHRYYELVVK